MKSKTSHHRKDFWDVEVSYGTWEEAEEVLTKVVKKIYEAPEIKEDFTSNELMGCSLVS